MSISGSLSDVSVADVIQFIHLGRRSGALVLVRGREEARFGFAAGKLVGARSPSTPNLGDLLLERGLVGTGALRRLSEAQQRLPGHVPLGQLLLRDGQIGPQDLRQALEDQIQRAVGEVMPWNWGSFEFHTENPTVDDFAVSWAESLPDFGINPQVVLLESARIFDERDARRGAAPVASGPAPRVSASPAATMEVALRTTREWRQALAPDLGEAGGEDALLGGPRLLLGLITSDDTLVARLTRALAEKPIDLRRTSWSDIATDELAVGRASAVLVDFRRGEADIERLAKLRRLLPATTIAALVGPGTPYRRLFEVGIEAVLPPETEAIAAFAEHLVYDLTVAKQPPAPTVARLRRVYDEVRSGLLSATVSLSLMHLISESFERAVLFLVRQASLAALGAFGDDRTGRPLAEATRGLQIEAAHPNLLTRCLRTRELARATFEEANLPAGFAAVLGRPRSGEVAVLPVVGTERVIAIVYADNGNLHRPAEGVEILDLAAAQVGLALENELLRRRVRNPGGS
jgi:hypothetical protein